MIRAAAKNHEHVTVVVDPLDYEQLAAALGGQQSAEEAAAFRRRLAWKAFQHTASYDSTVAEWLWSQVGKRRTRLPRRRAAHRGAQFPTQTRANCLCFGQRTVSIFGQD